MNPKEQTLVALIGRIHDDYVSSGNLSPLTQSSIDGVLSEKRTIDTTKQADAACKAAAKVNIRRQFALPDLEDLVRGAYEMGYYQALLDRPARDAGTGQS